MKYFRIVNIFLVLISVLVLFFSGVKAQALIFVPEGTIKLILNTNDNAGVFNFRITDNSAPPNSIVNAQLSQVNGVLSRQFSLAAFPTTYRIYSDFTPGPSVITCSSSTGSTSYSVTNQVVKLNLSSFDTFTCTFTVMKSTTTPLLLVPGVLGTELLENNVLLWPNIPKMLTDVGDDFMDGLMFNNAITPVSNVAIAKLVDNPFGAFDYSASLVQELKTKGYVENQTLFTFPYDWRYGVSGRGSGGELVNVEALKAKVAGILQQTGASKVDVVAHSTGGLLVKKYVMEVVDHRIGKAVFVGVPNTGAPKAVKVLLSGDNFGVPWLADGEMKKIGQNLPVVYDLAPSRTFVDTKGSFLKVINQKFLAKDTVEELPYDPAWDVVVNQRGGNQAALTNAENLHAVSFDNFDLRTRGVDMYNIVGCKSATIGQVVERRMERVLGGTNVTYDAPKEVPGDGTVPLESATNVPVDASKKFYSLKTEHGKMLSQDGIRQQIVNIVSGSTLATPNMTQDISKCKLNGKAHAIYSPVDIEVTDNLGNRLGFASDGSLQNSIPGADFSVWGDHKFVFLPDDEGQIYTIKLHGTDTGTFTYKTEEVVNNLVTETEVFPNIPVTPNLVGSVVSADGTTTLELDNNADGFVDLVAAPIILTQQETQDLVSPETTAQVSGTQGETGWYRSNVVINLSATDSAQTGASSSGLLDTKYKLDSDAATPYSAPVVVSVEGAHTLIYYSSDKAGNVEVEQVLNFTIDKTAPEISLQWDLGRKDIVCTGIDNAPVVVSDEGDEVIAKDTSGNTTTIRFAQKNRKSALRAEVASLVYNNTLASLGSNKVSFYWQFDKTGKLTLLSQYVASKKNYNILGLYNGQRTIILGLDQTGLINKNLPGLIPLKIQTSTGTLLWSY